MICIYLMGIAWSMNVVAQPLHHAEISPEQREKIESLKIGFVTEKLQLTPQEAEKFWPLYNQYKEEMKTLRNYRRNMNYESEKPIDNMSEQELIDFLENRITIEQKIVDLRKKYLNEYKRVLPLKKIALLYKAEDEFKMHLLHQTQRADKPHGTALPRKF